MYEDELKQSIREIPDFPKKGILFYDLSTLFLNGRTFALAVDLMAHRHLNKRIDGVMCIESRGFMLGSAIAYRLGTGVVMARKQGKLPWKTIGGRYKLEYGSDIIEIHADAIKKGQHILLVDDLLATGGTAATAVKLIERLGGKVVECLFLVELTGLKGREKLKGYKVHSILQYEGE